MRRPGRDWSKLDEVCPQPVLDLLGKKLSAAIGLRALNRERHLLSHSLEKRERVLRRPARIQPKLSKPAAIIDGRVLINARPDLHGIELHSITGRRPTVALGLLR